MSLPQIVLTEWSSVAAAAEGPGAALRDISLDDPVAGPRLRLLAERRILDVLESRRGVTLRARHFVGSADLGPFRLVIRPKLGVRELWTIVAWALELKHVKVEPPVAVAPNDDALAELLALLLEEEAEHRRLRGVRRGYVAREEWRGSPRGKLDLQALAKHMPLTRADLPCRFHELEADVLENQIVRAALRLARKASRWPEVRGRLARAEARWAELCSEVPLTADVFREAERRRNRLNASYAAAHRLAELIFAGTWNPDGEAAQGKDRLPGHFWDMQLLFERFVARFLAEHLQGFSVETQEQITDLYRVVQAPPGMRAPRPRPDLVLRHDGRCIAVADTKYISLSGEPLPRDILYQLSVYALAYAGEAGRAVPALALHPGRAAPDVVLALRHGSTDSLIASRAIDWSTAAALLRAGDRAGCARLAAQWIAQPAVAVAPIRAAGR